MLKIIGNGLIANAIKKNIDTDDFAFFASGVSNSTEENDKEFDREKRTFDKFYNEIYDDKRIVYFSTYSIFDSSLANSKYRKHKIEMESIVSGIKKHLIIRLPNVVGFGGNPNTMFNYFMNSILNNNRVTILKNSHRNLLDIDDIVCFLSHLDNKTPSIINLIHPISYRVTDIATLISLFLDKEVLIKKIEGGENYFLQPDDYVVNILQRCNVDLSEKYLEKIIKKYI